MTSKAHSSSLFISEKNKVAGGYVSDFSQWGLTNELVALPTISAPGGFMLSTHPLALGGYAVESGTSMATPYFAGCIALLFEARGKISSSTVQSLFATNSNPNVFHDGVSAYPWLDSVAQQGAGLINAYDAVHAKTVLNVSSISFNDTEYLTPTSFSLKNTGSQDVTYTIDQVGSGTVYTLANDGTTIPVFFDAGDFMETTATYASLSFSSKRVVVSPGQTAVVRVSAAPPKGLNASRIPIYSGYVTLNGTNGDSLSIPYLGAATSMRNVTILDTKHGDNVLKSSVSSKPVTAGQVFTFAGPHGAETNTSYPVFDLLLSMGTRLLEIDAKSSNGTVLGSIAQFPQEFKSRSATGASGVEWQGYMADGSNVPAGSYSLRVRALKIFGDPAKNSDYDVVETPWFKVRYVEGGLTPHRL
ncbi:uncharacterized protein N7529_000430 [Penicillium soppii]|uniref:uncharacterized protein n=1 Tax=Penicillium soppii TaxID=69789 RepID=UPI002548F7CA|nr:uncharacterized protein N7529_000430 [Penicillium soppii]KAJ5881758.1 hypothetical protein N7529_000430 [Penicillium soppii]